jgi:hypothetical protein
VTEGMVAYFMAFLKDLLIDFGILLHIIANTKEGSPGIEFF